MFLLLAMGYSEIRVQSNWGAHFQEVFEGSADVGFVVEVGATEASEGFAVGLSGGKVRF